MYKKTIEDQINSIEIKRSELKVKKQLFDILNSSPFKDRIIKLNEKVQHSRKTLNTLLEESIKDDNLLKASKTGSETVFQNIEKLTKVENMDVSNPPEARRALRKLLQAKTEPSDSQLSDVCSSFITMEEREACKISMDLAKKRVNENLKEHHFKPFKDD